MIRANRHNIISILDDMQTQFDWASIFKESCENNLLPKALVNYHGQIKFCNNSLSEWLGYKRNEILERTWMELTVPKYLETDLNLVTACLRNEINGYKLYKEYIHKNGEHLPSTLYITNIPKYSIFSVTIIPIED